MQTTLSRVWTWVIISISYDDINYTMNTYLHNITTRFIVGSSETKLVPPLRRVDRHPGGLKKPDLSKDERSFLLNSYLSHYSWQCWTSYSWQCWTQYSWQFWTLYSWQCWTPYSWQCWTPYSWQCWSLYSLSSYSTRERKTLINHLWLMWLLVILLWLVTE